MKEYCSLHKTIQVWVPKYKGESHICCFGFCKQQKMSFSIELNDEEGIFSPKKSRGRWLHTNSLGIISILLLCQSQHRSSYSYRNIWRWRKEPAFTNLKFPKQLLSKFSLYFICQIDIMCPYLNQGNGNIAVDRRIFSESPGKSLDN